MPWYEAPRLKISSNGYRSGGRLLPCLFLLLLVPLSAVAERLITPSDLASAGAPELALQLLNQQQPSYTDEPQRWIEWFRLRISVLERTSQWRKVIASEALLPSDVAREQVVWFLDRSISAQLKLSEGAAARLRLRGLMWQRGSSPSALKKWRLHVIGSYLDEGLIEDAYAATLRYQQDYPDSAAEARLLHARVFLASRRYAEALPLLKTLGADKRAQALLMLATLHSGADHGWIGERIDELLANPDSDTETQMLLWTARVELSATTQQVEPRISALEQLFALRFVRGEGRGIGTQDDYDLWRAYIDYAAQFSNRQQLLRGSDERWFELAEQYVGEGKLAGRALYVWLAHNALKPEHRDLAHSRFIESLVGQAWGNNLLQQLYLASNRFGKPEGLPVPVRYHFAGIAIADGRLDLASRLMRSLEDAPQGSDGYLWQLRRARVFILAGEAPRAIKVLNGLLSDYTDTTPRQLDLYIQALFDLQGVKENEVAYRLLRQLYLKVGGLKRRRELLYWMADSKSALGDYIEAGRLYLQSAILPGVSTMDPWAQTARYQAATTLAKAGLTRDARGIYQQLLKATKEPARRVVLKRELERLRLDRVAQ